jgi:F-type H+-transporting ATPase subunit epsilon
MALPTSIELQIVRPDRLLVREQVDEVEIPGSEGYFGVLPGHTPMLASLAVGEMWYRKGQEKTYLALAFGFAEVLPDRVTILARIAEVGHEIDVARAEEALKRAQAQAQAVQKERVDYEQARLDLMKAITRLQVASRLQLAGRVGHQRMPPPQG